jgi:hypothetical protein
MIPEMARFLIEKTSEPEDTVLDPFCGSGTVVRESMAMGRNAIGIDSNPLAALLSRAKIGDCLPELLEQQLKRLLNSFSTEKDSFRLTFPNASYWFTPATLRKLGTVRLVIDNIAEEVSAPYADFWRAVLASIVRRSSRADPRGPKPFISKRAREHRLGRHFDPFTLFAQAARDRIRSVAAIEDHPAFPRSQVILGSAKNLPQCLRSARVDAVVTSPPYLNAQDYYRSCKLEIWVVGLMEVDGLRQWARDGLVGSDRISTDLQLLGARMPSATAAAARDRLAPASPRNACILTKYALDMAVVLAGVVDVLKPGGYCAIVSGDNTLSDVPIETHQVLAELALDSGLELRHHYVDRIRNRWVPPSRNGHSGVILSDHMQVFQRPWATGKGSESQGPPMVSGLP